MTEGNGGFDDVERRTFRHSARRDVGGNSSASSAQSGPFCTGGGGAGGRVVGAAAEVASGLVNDCALAELASVVAESHSFSSGLEKETATAHLWGPSRGAILSPGGDGEGRGPLAHARAGGGDAAIAALQAGEEAHLVLLLASADELTSAELISAELEATGSADLAAGESASAELTSALLELDDSSRTVSATKNM
ncbi:unnamed protein product [Ixodes persulcatus]